MHADAAVTAAGNNQLFSRLYSCYLEKSAKPPFPRPYSRMKENWKKFCFAKRQKVEGIRVDPLLNIRYAAHACVTVDLQIKAEK